MRTVERLSWQQLVNLVSELAGIIALRGIDANMIVAVARGGFVPARLLSDLLGVKRLASVGIRYVDEARTQNEIYSFPQPMGPAHRVLLVEDLLESGNSMAEVRAALTRAGARVWTATLFHHASSVIKPDFSLGVKNAELVLPWDQPIAAAGFACSSTGS